MFSAVDLSLGVGRAFFACAGPAIELVMDRLSFVVLFLCFRPLVGTKISAVSIDHFLFAGQQIGGNGDIMHVGGGYLYGINQSALSIHTDVGRMAEMPCIPFLQNEPLNPAASSDFWWRKTTK